MGIVVKLTLFVSFLLAVLTTLAGFLINQQTSEVIVQSESRAFELVFRVLDRSIQEELDYAELALDSQLNNPEVVRLFESRDRVGLLAYFMNFYPSIKTRINRIHLHLPDGRTFLRVHQPEHFDDHIARLRPMLQSMHQRPRPLRGLELGVYGLGLRVIKPVWSARGDYVGALEYSMEFGLQFLRRLRQNFEGDYFLQLFQPEPPGYQALAGTAEVDQCPTTPDVLQRIKNEDRFWLTACDAQKAVGYFPLRFYHGEVGGYIKIQLDRGVLVRDILFSRERLSYLGLGMVIIVALASFGSLSFLLRPLRQAVEQAALIRKSIGEELFRPTLNPFRDHSDLPGIIQEIETIVKDLKDQHRMLISIAEGVPGLVLFFSADGVLQWANKVAIKTLGLGPTFPARLGEDLPETGFFEGERERIQTVVSSQSPVGLCLCQDAPSGTSEAQVCWEHTAIPVIDSEGSIRSIIRISQDVTDKVQNQRRLEEWTLTLEAKVEEALAQQREQELRALQQARLAAIGELAAGIAHEINQPLNSISFGLENTFDRLRAGNLDQDYIDKKSMQLQQDLDRIRRIINHVRLFAREYTHSSDAAFVLQNALKSALELFHVQFSTMGIDVELLLPEEEVSVYGDGYQFEQVVINLLSNARDALEEAVLTTNDPAAAIQPRIGLNLYRLQDRVVVEVKDNGPGIPREIHDRILDPFFSTKAHGKGTGLGLSISYGILKSMGASLSWESSPGNTVFRIEFSQGVCS